jgi:PASTA domain-containing protein
VKRLLKLGVLFVALATAPSYAQTFTGWVGVPLLEGGVAGGNGSPDSEYLGWVGIPLRSGTSTVPPIAVPNVVGQATAAAADMILEGVGLDAGTVTAICSGAANNSVISQAPAAGVLVSLGSIVDLFTSNGVACVGGIRLILDINLGVDK